MASHRARKKQRSSDVDSKPFSPLLDQENSDVLTSSGATQNAELVAAAQEALDKILTLFPGLDTDSALGLGKGGQQVPIRQSSINDLGERYYKEPNPYHGSMFRDIDDEEKVLEWKRHLLSVNVQYIVANSEDQIYFLSANERQDLKSNKVTEAFVDTSITLHKRVLSNPSLLQLLLESDEVKGNPFDSWAKLQILVQKSKTAKNIEWYDGWQNNYLSQDLLTWRGLKDGLNGKGTVDLFVGQMDLRLHLQQHVPVHVPELDSTQEARSVLPVTVLAAKKNGGGKEAVEKAPVFEEETVKKIDNTTKMQQAFAATAFGEWRGQVDAETRQITKLVAIYLDTKTVGEAATQPAVRMPPLREGRHNRLFSAAIALRWNEEDKSLHEGDGIVIQDGGLWSSLMSALKTPTNASLPKPKITKYLLWSEQSLRARKTRDKGAQLTQIERLQVILPEDEAETWRMTLAKKKLLFGPAGFIKVGSKGEPQPPESKTSILA
ncbi:unnamed protein product [Cladocopium goreaui]|uniref:Uncharacterized protein n=1 Tax=Cladocopium goreaui TaxID=2562237 RepID=A0A9P1C5D3_9DINO|nr:unnamed protein product [Cladocopium goreaui]CAI3991847.1 unnamed protein product [Cladocopium goreaui]